ncbi:MAG TPA: hypothetical protein ENG95_00260 [Nitrospirae bacterium]|nr:hypothetical protein BMS3Abin10_00426 [bacterium BMS3Abin10]GBE39227.1 hypothetical protein BMS3Bbin08_01849 [bacterium BMS3Bbin08]HDH00635.1 hypothetical protein [Nitrospirota bacterium]HDH51738.1 hypothetical protein [Nitrospirota bacterium]HDK81616.1 hypothetical protein [Nitrospirota bacterium]
MSDILKREYEKSVEKADYLKKELNDLENTLPHDKYNITITRDRLAYWEGRSEGLKFALDHVSK